MTGQVTAPLLQASSVHPPSYARANWSLPLLLLPSYKSLPFLSPDPTRKELGILKVQRPPFNPAVLGKLLVFAFFPLCCFLPAFLPWHVDSTRTISPSSGDRIMMPGLRVEDSSTPGKWSILSRSTSMGCLLLLRLVASSPPVLQDVCKHCLQKKQQQLYDITNMFR